jgi:hypothetical protein
VPPAQIDDSARPVDHGFAPTGRHRTPVLARWWRSDNQGGRAR